VKFNLLWLSVLSLSACSVMTADPWSWLDDPVQQKWVEVSLLSDDWEVHFQVPDRRNAGIERLKSTPPLEKGADSFVIEIPKISNRESKRLAYFQWESWWGGFLKESGVDFRLDIWVYRYPNEQNLLDLEINERIERRISQWEDEYSDPLMRDSYLRDAFFKNFEIRSYESVQGLEWVFENSPSTKSDSVSYMIPLSEYEILDVGFFVNEKRYDRKEDPGWNQRRWDLSRKILDTVTITRRQ